MKRIICLLSIIVMIICILTGCARESKEIVFADAGWDSAKLNNAVAGYIAKAAYGYDNWREVSGSTTVLHEGLIKGEIDIHMEVWTDNIVSYKSDLENGRFKELGINFNDNIQGLYVPRYVIEGDKDRGIKASAPDLKTVEDLKKYKDVFQDAENKDKGRIYGAIPGWEVDSIMFNKYNYYGLNKDFIYFRPGSDAALSAAISGAYEKGEPIVAYYWEPTWLMGKYDFVLLKDAPYDPIGYKEGKTECPSVVVTIGSSNKFYENNKEFCGFLENYKTSSNLISEALAYMQETGASHEEAAIWFLKENDNLLEGWLGNEKADEIRKALNSDVTTTGWSLQNYFNIESIDSAVRKFSIKFQPFFNAIKSGLDAMILFSYTILNFIPWWVIVIGVFISGWKLKNKLSQGIIYAFMISIIKFLGLWGLMNETLSIVITSVIVSVILGFPIGLLIASNETANRITRPILDTMQTMPVFVYLIPAVLFFGLGKAPAVIATTIYAIVPIVRLTSLGIRQVDKEVVEAAKSFGATKLQCLIKVQIPQAVPTIMTGFNQTLMMAMAMVVTCSMIGASGLGMEVLIGVNRIEIGRGLVAGTAVVIVAVLLDRLTQGLIKGNGGKM